MTKPKPEHDPADIDFDNLQRPEPPANPDVWEGDNT